MNILLIDRSLPSSLYSGKTLRLKNIYGDLAQEMKVIYLRTSQIGQYRESEEMNLWSKRVFSQCLRLPGLPAPALMARIRSVAALRPSFDIFNRYPAQLKSLFHHLYRIATFYDVHLVATLGLEVSQYGLLLSQCFPWVQDLGESKVAEFQNLKDKGYSRYEHFPFYLRILKEMKFEQEMAAKATATIFSPQSSNSWYGIYPDARIEIIPDGIDTDHFDPNQIIPCRQSEPFLLFVGHMNSLANQDAMKFFAGKIFPLIRKQFIGLELKIVGAEPSEEIQRLSRIPGIEVTGAVPDVRPYLAGALAMICPLRMPSAIEHKLLEAMAMGVPIIASPLAAKAIPEIPEEFIRPAVKAEDYVIAIGNLLHHRDKVEIHGDLARAFVKKKFSWDRTVSRYRNLFYGITGSHVRTNTSEE